MMATNGKYQNISIQPTTVPRTSKTLYELPRENLTEDELYRKSTSDRTKRRVAHKARFPLPVITKPFFAEKPQRKLKIKQVIKNKLPKENLTEDKLVRKSTSDSTKRHVAHKMPRENLAKDKRVRKSTSDSTNRHVAHKAWIPPPVITKPAVVAEKPQKKHEINQVIKKMPRENFTEDEPVRKSTSDGTKRHVALKAWCPPPVITEPAVVAEKPHRKRKINQVIVESIFIRKVRQHAVIAGTEQSYRQVETSSSIEEVYEIVKSEVKRKSEDFGGRSVIKRNKKY